MQYLISFLEGFITFVSPCLLPMLPVYISYFAGGGQRTVKKTVTGALGFVLGFTFVFVAMGALAGTVGGFLRQYRTWVDLVCGLAVVLFGLHFLGVFKFTLFQGVRRRGQKNDFGFFSCVLFGIIFSVGWTPCVGAFLGSALMLSSQQGSTVVGIFMLLCYSLGLGLPFLLSAVLIEKLKTAFDWIKRHYQIINTACGILLVAVGVLMATGLMGKFLGLLG